MALGKLALDEESESRQERASFSAHRSLHARPKYRGTADLRATAYQRNTDCAALNSRSLIVFKWAQPRQEAWGFVVCFAGSYSSKVDKTSSAQPSMPHAHLQNTGCVLNCHSSYAERRLRNLYASQDSLSLWPPSSKNRHA